MTNFLVVLTKNYNPLNLWVLIIGTFGIVTASFLIFLAMNFYSRGGLNYKIKRIIIKIKNNSIFINLFYFLIINLVITNLLKLFSIVGFFINIISLIVIFIFLQSNNFILKLTRLNYWFWSRGVFFNYFIFILIQIPFFFYLSFMCYISFFLILDSYLSNLNSSNLGYTDACLFQLINFLFFLRKHIVNNFLKEILEKEMKPVHFFKKKYFFDVTFKQASWTLIRSQALVKLNPHGLNNDIKIRKMSGLKNSFLTNTTALKYHFATIFSGGTAVWGHQELKEHKKELRLVYQQKIDNGKTIQELSQNPVNNHNIKVSNDMINSGLNGLTGVENNNLLTCFTKAKQEIEEEGRIINKEKSVEVEVSVPKNIPPGSSESSWNFFS